MIIGISGKARSGKGVFASVAVNEFDAQELSFAGVLKEEIIDFLNDWEIPFEDRNLYGENVDKEEVIQIPAYLCMGDLIEEYPFLASNMRDLNFRTLMQLWGTEYRRMNFGDNYWVDKAMSKCIDQNLLYVISDVRFPNEACAIQDRGGKLVRIERMGRPKVSNSEHASEIALDNWKDFDCYLYNDSTLENYEDMCRNTIRSILDGGFETKNK